MPQVDVFYNSANTSAGDGSKGNPFRDPGVNDGAFQQANVRRFMHGDFDFSVRRAPWQWFSQPGQIILPYGTDSHRPKWRQSRTIGSGSWTFDAGLGLYWAHVTNPGNVRRGGVPLIKFHMDSNIGAAAGAMPSNSYCIDYNASPKRVYIKISGGIGDAALVVTAAVNETPFEATCITVNGGHSHEIHHIELDGASRHGIVVNSPNTLISDVFAHNIGGQRDVANSYWLGNGIEVTEGGSGSKIIACQVDVVYDSPYSLQPYSGSALLENCDFIDNDADNFGLAAYEMVTQVGGDNIRNSLIRGGVVSRGGEGFCGWCSSRNNPGGLISIVCNNGPNTSNVTGLVFEDITATNVRNVMNEYSKAASNNTLRRVRAVNASRSSAAAVFRGQVLGGANINIDACIFSGFNIGIDGASTFGGGTALTVENSAIINCGTAITSNGNSNNVLRNNLIQACDTVASGGAASFSKTTNYLGGNGGLGNYTLAGGDVSGAAIAFDAGTQTPVVGAATYSGGTNLGNRTDIAGVPFTSGTWARGPYAKHPSTVPVAITNLPIGDSTTNGGGQGSIPEEAFVSDRGYQVATLAAAGYTVEFVGPQSNLARLGNTTWHAGWGGANIGPDLSGNNIAARLVDIKKAFPNPTIIELMIGINTWWGNGNGPAVAAQDYRNLAYRIGRYWRKSKILLSPPARVNGLESDSNAPYYLELRDVPIAIANESGLDNFFFADTGALGLLVQGDWVADGTHFSPTGGAKIGQVRANAMISQILSSVPVPPPVTLTAVSAFPFPRSHRDSIKTGLITSQTQAIMNSIAAIGSGFIVVLRRDGVPRARYRFAGSMVAVGAHMENPEGYVEVIQQDVVPLTPGNWEMSIQNPLGTVGIRVPLGTSADVGGTLSGSLDAGAGMVFPAGCIKIAFASATAPEPTTLASNDPRVLTWLNPNLNFANTITAGSFAAGGVSGEINAAPAAGVVYPGDGKALAIIGD